MPPNRKAELADALPVGENFSGYVKSSPYAPLTEDQREGNITQEQRSFRLNDDLTRKQSSQSKEVLQRIVQEEWLRQLFSAKHITDNLIAEALKLKNGQVTSTDNRSESIDYWAMSTAIMAKEHALKRVDRMEENLKPGISTESASPPTKSGENPCLTWPSGASKERFINEIIELERIRQLLAVDHIEKNLIQTKMHMSTTVVNTENDSYWTF